jgi:hypothetical protein
MGGRSTGGRPKHTRRKGAKTSKQGQKRQLQRMELSEASDDSAAADLSREDHRDSDAGVVCVQLDTPLTVHKHDYHCKLELHATC